MFSNIRYVSITELGLSQIYLNKQKLLTIEKWFDPNDLSNFKPLPVHDFGNKKLTLTDGHSRAFVANKHGVDKITKDYTIPTYKYVTPEEQGLAIKKCTILEAAKIEYSNRTVLLTNK